MDVTATTQTGNQQGTILDGAESADQKICGMTTCIMDAMTAARCWHRPKQKDQRPRSKVQGDIWKQVETQN